MRKRLAEMKQQIRERQDRLAVIRAAEEQIRRKAAVNDGPSFALKKRRLDGQFQAKGEIDWDQFLPEDQTDSSSGVRVADSAIGSINPELQQLLQEYALHVCSGSMLTWLKDWRVHLPTQNILRSKMRNIA